MTLFAETIWRDFEFDGIASSGPHDPLKSEIREWGAYLESFATMLTAAGGKVYQTKAAMNADLAPSANDPAIVLNDPTPSNNGLYRKVGASGTGSWALVLPFVPGYQFIKAADAGAGTANAIQATSSIPIPSAANAALIFMSVFEPNSGAVTLSINGETPKPLVTNSGNALAAGYLAAGLTIAFVFDGTNYRLLTDIVSTSIVTAAEAAAAEAAASAQDAVDAALSVNAVGIELAIEIFFTPGFNIATDDITPIWQAADDYSADHGVTIAFSRGPYRIKSGCKLDRDGSKFRFNGSRFLVDDSAAMMQTIFSGGAGGTLAGRVGVLMAGNNGFLAGPASFEGQGTLGTTTLAHMVHYKQTSLDASLFRPTFIAAAAGRFVQWCTSCSFGDVIAVDMYGAQTFSSGTAGTAEVCNGNTRCTFGSIRAIDNYKPGRYLSVGGDDANNKVTNLRCTFGPMIVKGRSGSAESSALAVRAAIECEFGMVIATGTCFGITLQRYDTDSGWDVDSNHFAGVISDAPSQASSSSIALQALGESAASLIGNNEIDVVWALNYTRSDSQGIAYLAHNAKRTRVKSLTSVNCDRALSMQSARHEIDAASMTLPKLTPIIYTEAASGYVRNIEMLSGTVNASQNLIQNIGSAAVTDLRFGNIYYNRAGTGTTAGNDITLGFLDSLSSPRGVRVHDLIGKNARWSDGVDTTVRNGELIRNFSLAATASLAAGATDTVTQSWTGLVTGDSFKLDTNTATPGAFLVRPGCYAADTLTIETINVGPAAAVRPARTVSVSAKLK